MGQKHSKSPKKSKSKINTSRTLTATNSDSNIRVHSASRFDEKAVKTLRLELEETPEIFVLNNILLSVMFFENYKKDILKLAHSTTTRIEKELNPKLLREETSECITPDPIFEKLNKNMRFRPLHGPKKLRSEPLMPRRIYVINDNIEAFDIMDSPHYTKIDKQGYQVQVEESKHKGFVKLRQLLDSTTSSTATNTVTVSEPGPSARSNDDNEFYEYSTITDIKTPKPLTVIMNCERRDTLPKTCFASRKIPKLHNERFDEEENNDESSLHEEISEDDLYENISYISSKGFMQYFQNGVFPNTLGRALGFDQNEINLAKAIPAMVFCNLMDEDDNVIPCEIIPSVALQWPASQAFEFEMREERPTITDYTSGIRYRWPTHEMVAEIKTLSCCLVPKGYFKKIGDNTDNEIEWEINFPRAERYIESRMSHAQLRSFLCLLTLYRTYIEPVTAKHGLLAEHIRCHMYWECEENYMKWPEHQLGSKLMLVMQNLKSRISKGQLPDYFIKQKNLFENIPMKYLRFAQKTLHDIMESPAMYFIGALRNLRYTNGNKFYLPLDFKELYKILTTDGCQYINANLSNHIPRRGVPVYRRKRHQDPIIDWKRKREMVIKEKVIKRREEEERIENETAERKKSVDSIDYKWICEKGFDPFKTRSLLLFFIKHFIEIARKSRQISTKEQTLFYLKQAYYLAKVLEDTDGSLDDGREFLNIIAKEEEICKKVAAGGAAAVDVVIEHHPPSTPKRNSVQFTWEITQQVKSNNINLNNLNKSYNGDSSDNGLITTKFMPRTQSNLKKSLSMSSEAKARKSVVFVETSESYT